MTTQTTNTAQTAILLMVILLVGLLIGQELLPKVKGLSERNGKAIRNARIEQVMKI